MRVRFTPASQWDIGDIYDAIAPHNPAAAERVEQYIRKTALDLAQFPLVGVATDVEEVRRLPLVRYPFTLFYRVSALEDAVEILRVVRSSRVKRLGSIPE